MSIHAEHPFATPPQHRSPARRLRGRLAGTVTLWASGRLNADAAGLTVSSLLVAEGETSQVVALLNPDADLTERLSETSSACVSILPAGSRRIAEVFAGLAPFPGGMFRATPFVDTEWGPRLPDADTWVGLRLVEPLRPLGWSTLAVCTIEHLEVGSGEVLTHVRGQYGSA